MHTNMSNKRCVIPRLFPVYWAVRRDKSTTRDLLNSLFPRAIPLFKGKSPVNEVAVKPVIWSRILSRYFCSFFTYSQNGKVLSFLTLGLYFMVFWVDNGTHFSLVMTISVLLVTVTVQDILSPNRGQLSLPDWVSSARRSSKINRA